LKLADWARKNGFDYKTAYRLFFRSGKFPRPVEQLPTGTILAHDLPVTTNNAVLYARVSPGDQAADLDRQMQRLRDTPQPKDCMRSRRSKRLAPA